MRGSILVGTEHNIHQGISRRCQSHQHLGTGKIASGPRSLHQRKYLHRNQRYIYRSPPPLLTVGAQSSYVAKPAQRCATLHWSVPAEHCNRGIHRGNCEKPELHASRTHGPNQDDRLRRAQLKSTKPAPNASQDHRRAGDAHLRLGYELGCAALVLLRRSLRKVHRLRSRIGISLLHGAQLGHGLLIHADQLALEAQAAAFTRRLQL
eukprot:6178513-Pleurochrysis_carterae.AAC.1